MTGAEVRELIVSSGVKLWQVAEKLGVNDGNFSRRLRKPFDDKETETVIRIITEIKQGNKPALNTLELFPRPSSK